MKKILALIQVIILALAAWGITPAAAAEYPFNENAVTIISNKEELGSVYFDDDAIGFLIQIKNPTQYIYIVNLLIEVYDEDNTLLWMDTFEPIALDEKASIVQGFSPTIEKYGIHTIKATLTGNFDTIIATRTFSKAAKNQKKSDSLGIQTHFSNLYGYEKETPTIHLAENGGVGYIRDGYNWSYVETKLSENKDEKIYTFPQWREDNINQLIAAGNKYLMILGFMNPLYDENTMPYSEEGVAAYALFCAAAAEHFKGRIDTFEIGNEPDHPHFANRDASGDEYARLLKAARDAIKNVDENITVVGGSLCSHRSLENQEFLSEFITEMNANGGWKNYMDAISYHPYSPHGEYSDEVEYMTFLQNLDYIQERLGGDIPVWITEYGLSTNQNEAGEYIVSESMQAADLVRTIVASKSEPTIQNLFVYNFRKTWPSMTEREHNFGIVYEDYSAKPAYIALSYMNCILKDVEFVGRIINKDYYSSAEQSAGKSNRANSVYRFQRGKEKIFVLWGHTGKVSQLQISNTNAGLTGIVQNGNDIFIHANANETIVAYDMYGNIIESTAIALTNEPVYVVCKEGISVTESDDFAIINGAAKPFSNLTLLAKRRGSLEKGIYAIRQTCSDENGNFEFKIKMADDDAYVFYIAESGQIQSMNIGETAYEIDAVCSVDGVEIDEVDRLKSGTTVDVSLKLQDNNGLGQNLLFMGALTSKNHELKVTKLCKPVWVNNSAEVSFSIDIDDAEDIENIKLFLWDEECKPISSPLVLK